MGTSRAPLAMAPGYPRRVDDEYSRHGTCKLFAMVEPFQGWRPRTVPSRRPQREFAQGLAALVDRHFPAAEKLRVVLDKLSTPTPGALYEALPPAAARRILRELEFHPTPVQGRWLTMAEIALAGLARQCWQRRIAQIQTLTPEVAAWAPRRNHHPATIDGRFTTKDARITLKTLYPKELL